MRSEAPFTTFGWSVKSPVEFTKPVSFTTRCTRSRSPPQAAFTWATMLMAQSLAAACPSSRDRKSTRLNSITNEHLVRRLLLEKKTTPNLHYTIQSQTINTDNKYIPTSHKYN